MSRRSKNTVVGLLAPVVLALALTGPVRADETQAMRQVLDRISAKDWAGAAAIAPHDVARDLVVWSKLRAGDGLLGDYEAFLKRRPDWPGLPFLRQKGEAAVARSNTPDRVVAYFNGQTPQTGEGAVALVRALQALGRRDQAEDRAMQAWSDLTLSAEHEAALLSLSPQSVALVHELRMDRLLWQERRAEAQRMLPRLPADWQALAKARMGLQTGADGVTALINAVPQSRATDPGLAFDRFIWRMKRDLYDEALPLILDRSANAAALGDPQAWAARRAVLTRWLLRQNRPAEAYRVASSHHLTAGGGYADLEFLSGFIALRRLNDPARALEHFRHLEAGVATPISLSRALYWQGRAQEAGGARDAAQRAYQSAARHQTAYYGLLAAEKLGLSLDATLLSAARPADWRQAGWTRSSVHQAALLALRAGDRNLAKRFWLHLAESLDATGLDQLGDMALALNEPHIAVLIGKHAAERSIILPRAYYPITDLVPDGLAVSRAFALAIARRESEFEPSARSPADARGLMQLLPGTAKMMADKVSVPFDAGRLTRDPGYNAILGGAYLKQLVDEFGPSIALVASGYNAGPGRPRRWITEYGDPRRADVDVIDWVESIPFTETRTYVMRVIEGVILYRAKLRGTPGPVNVTGELKG
ncbi:MAG: lytic transglycosylase domain-containing protein [Pseudotabrizicola sp.]|uniref:lytic transglycosylase domain-containing protein n=1 Tax=Pseudotabrizicola sp. TaxID=2939647 RepID=UPI002730BA8A|nr:lytic transglycosylase domain-containing protein [Pseudotabrizicola sp.]MDP2082298.1 lytic transglycosylase domain-containing protein [Pseudotabrizicola sp.]MDZ7575218.1 lytic transglycosylase domain-containing protein [Pseudotabrizicola sp.]